MLLNPCFLKIEIERDLGQRCFVAAEPSMQTRAKSFHCKTRVWGCSENCNYYYFASVSCQGGCSQALPSHPPAEGFLFLPRVSNFSTLETGLVIWVLPRFMSPLPARYLERLIKATLLSLSWHDFLEPLQIKPFSSWYNTTTSSCPSVGWSQLLSSSAPNEGELYISCLRPSSHRLASQPNAVSDNPHHCPLHPPACGEPLGGAQRL